MLQLRTYCWQHTLNLFLEQAVTVYFGVKNLLALLKREIV